MSRNETIILKDLLKSSLIKVITGPRRAGRSTLAFQALSQSKFGYFNFEDDLLPSNIDSDLLIESLMYSYDFTSLNSTGGRDLRKLSS